MEFYENNDKFRVFPTNNFKKPILVDNKILKKIKKTKSKIKENSFPNQVKKNCLSFITNNYGIIIILIILFLLLYYRYQDVKKRRENKVV
tara:strand:+ start:542 stop:811 length:270 start_codon:yes stop_codon:yes gene_type:complete